MSLEQLEDFEYLLERVGKRITEFKSYRNIEYSILKFHYMMVTDVNQIDEPTKWGYYSLLNRIQNEHSGVSFPKPIPWNKEDDEIILNKDEAEVINSIIYEDYLNEKLKQFKLELQKLVSDYSSTHYNEIEGNLETVLLESDLMQFEPTIKFDTTHIKMSRLKDRIERFQNDLDEIIESQLSLLQASKQSSVSPSDRLLLKFVKQKRSEANKKLKEFYSNLNRDLVNLIIAKQKVDNSLNAIKTLYSYFINSRNLMDKTRLLFLLTEQIPDYNLVRSFIEVDNENSKNKDNYYRYQNDLGTGRANDILRSNRSIQKIKAELKSAFSS